MANPYIQKFRFSRMLLTTIGAAAIIAPLLRMALPGYIPPDGPTEPQLLEQSLVRRLTPAEFLSLSEAGRDYVRQYGREL